MIRALAIEVMLLALRGMVPLSAFMLLLAVCWVYAVMLSGGAWVVAWVLDQIVSLLSTAC